MTNKALVCENIQSVIVGVNDNLIGLVLCLVRVSVLGFVSFLFSHINAVINCAVNYIHIYKISHFSVHSG